MSGGGLRHRKENNVSNTIEQELEQLTDRYARAMNELEQLRRPSSREATFSINFQMIDKWGAPFTATMREGVTKEIIKQVFEGRHEFIELALKSDYRIPGRASVGEIPAQPSVPAPVSPSAPPPPVPANGNGQGSESLCSMIEIGTSFTSKKPQLKFHCNGLEHPLTFTKSTGEMAKLLAPLGYTEAHMVVGQKYPTSAMVKWEPNGQYKNVLAVRPA